MKISKSKNNNLVRNFVIMYICKRSQLSKSSNSKRRAARIGAGYIFSFMELSKSSNLKETSHGETRRNCIMASFAGDLFDIWKDNSSRLAGEFFALYFLLSELGPSFRVL